MNKTFQEEPKRKWYHEVFSVLFICTFGVILNIMYRLGWRPGGKGSDK